MKLPAFTLLALLTTFGTTADDWKKERSVSNFTGVSVSSGINLYLTQGNTEKLLLDVKGLDESEVKSEIKNGELRLYVDRGKMGGWLNLGGSRSVKAYLTFRQLTSLTASGGADVTGQNSMRFDDLSLKTSGGTNAKLDLKANNLKISASGGADTRVQGSARNLDAEASGGADLDARDLTVEVCNAQSSGGSDLYVNASKEVRMRASGGADIYHYGSAKVVSQSKSGGADIRHRN